VFGFSEAYALAPGYGFNALIVGSVDAGSVSNRRAPLLAEATI
jgi:hypothetical protein